MGCNNKFHNQKIGIIKFIKTIGKNIDNPIGRDYIIRVFNSLPKDIIKHVRVCLTLWRRNYFFSFSTCCILIVNNTGTKQVSTMKHTAF